MTSDQFVYITIDSIDTQSEAATVTISILSPSCFEIPCYPFFTRDIIPKADKNQSSYEWHNIEVFESDGVINPIFETNVQDTTMATKKYFLAGFDGFLSMLYLEIPLVEVRR